MEYRIGLDIGIGSVGWQLFPVLRMAARAELRILEPVYLNPVKIRMIKNPIARSAADIAVRAVWSADALTESSF